MIALDCSAAMQIAKRTEVGLAFQGLLFPDEEIIAPSFFAAEVANVSWKYVHANLGTVEQSERIMQDALALPDRLEPMDDYLEEAFQEGVALDHSVYDMLYLVLARRKHATLVTCDKRLRELCHQMRVNCFEEVELAT